MTKHTKIAKGEYRVVCQLWEESEKGFGCRPDGFSLHDSEVTCDAFIDQYWERMPDSPPSEYARPYGEAFVTGVSIEVYAEIIALNSLRFGDKYKVPKPLDGWAD